MADDLVRYDMIVEEFSEEVISDRYKYLYDKIKKYIEERECQDILIINEELLQQAVMDYFADVYRLKVFHKIEHINMTKIVAYEVYWLLKRKPIQLPNHVENNKFVFANEGFLTTFIAHELLVPDETSLLSEQEKEDFLKLLKHINYHLKYRSIDKQSLELLLLSFETGTRITKS